jgi:CheY-like chemotaxis protein/anti-sigma regulatory factor (Ser/Thr protein kinase)
VSLPVLLLVLGVAGVGLVALGAVVRAWRRERARAERLAHALEETREQLAEGERLHVLGEIAVGFAQRFNDLLTPVLGRAQLVLRRIGDPEVRHWVSMIETSALDAAQVARQLQKLAGHRDDHRLLDLRRVVEEAVARAVPRAGGIELRLPDDVPPIRGDRVALRHAVTGFLTNAIEAAGPRGHVTVAVAVDAADVAVVVTDDGPGISAEAQGRMFEPFVTTRAGAAGLGLAAAYGVALRHGGSVEVQSAAGQGTTIRLRLPRPDAPPAPAALPPAGVEPTGLRRARCLVVDDDPQVRDVLRDILVSEGHDVVVARDGADGIEKFRASAFDMVITDLAMPGLNGLELTAACKRLRPAVPVLLLSGWDVVLSEQQLADSGVDAHLAKPVQVADLLTAVAAFRA